MTPLSKRQHVRHQTWTVPNRCRRIVQNIWDSGTRNRSILLRASTSLLVLSLLMHAQPAVAETGATENAPAKPQTERSPSAPQETNDLPARVKALEDMIELMGNLSPTPPPPVPRVAAAPAAA